MIKSTLKISGKTYESKGKTVLEAITSLKPEIARGMGLLTITNGEATKEKVLTSHTVRGMFGAVSRLQKEVALKNISQLFPNDIL